MDVTTYCTTDAVKAELAIIDGADDMAVQLAVEAASRQIDEICGQRFWFNGTASARTFAPTDSMFLRLEPDGIATTTDLAVKLDLDDSGSYETTLTAGTDYVLQPTNAAQLYPQRPYTEVRMTGRAYQFAASMYGRDLVQITAKWGWPAVPANVEKACLVQAVHLFKSRDAQMGAVFFQGGDAVGALRVSGLHPIARNLIGPYQRPLVQGC